MSRESAFWVGNGKIDPYPLEKLLIFTEELFKSLKKELAQFTTKKPKETKPNVCKVEHPSNIKKQQVSQRIIHDYEPSHIWNTRNSPYWQWRRVKEWFNQYAQNNEQEMTLENILKQLVE